MPTPPEERQEQNSFLKGLLTNFVFSLGQGLTAAANAPRGRGEEAALGASLMGPFQLDQIRQEQKNQEAQQLIQLMGAQNADVSNQINLRNEIVKSGQDEALTGPMNQQSFQRPEILPGVPDPSGPDVLSPPSSMPVELPEVTRLRLAELGRGEVSREPIVPAGVRQVPTAFGSVQRRLQELGLTVPFESALNTQAEVNRIRETTPAEADRASAIAEATQPKPIEIPQQLRDDLLGMEEIDPRAVPLMTAHLNRMFQREEGETTREFQAAQQELREQFSRELESSRQAFQRSQSELSRSFQLEQTGAAQARVVAKAKSDISDGYAAAFSVLDDLDKRIIPVNKSDSKIAQAAHVGLLASTFDENLAMYEAASGSLATIARAFGEVGSLSDGDVARVMASLPTAFDTGPVARAKLARIRDILTNAKAERLANVDAFLGSGNVIGTINLDQ